jgi:hypothetical protein
MLNRIIRADISDERDRQEQMYGEGHTNEYPVWMTILGEEFGECCQALLKMRQMERDFPNHVPDRNGLKCLRRELIHVAAVAVAAIEQIDRELK